MTFVRMRQTLSVVLRFVERRSLAHWESTYRGAHRFKAPKTFLLGGSGHNAGTINPPAARKHGYWTSPNWAATPEEWLAGAERHDGSWWTLWSSWLRENTGSETT